MIIRIGRGKVNAKCFIYIILLVTLFMGTLSDDLGLPQNIRYLNDIFVLILFLLIIFQRAFLKQVKRAQLNGILITMLIFSIVNFISIFINLVPLNLVLWAIRNTYRFFVFYWACVFFLDKTDLEKIINFLYYLQWINVVLVIYQFFVLGLSQDNLGGLFGHGGNAGLLIYNTLLLSYALSKYTARQYSLFKFLFVFISTSLTSVLAEIRVFFIIVLIIILINLIITRQNFKKVVVYIGAVVLFFIGVDIYSNLFPYVDLSFEALFKEGTSTGGGYNLSRLNAFSEINNLFFHDNIVKNALGLGFGNCEYSSLDFFVSSFFKNYGFLNYRWFAHQWIFLETGYAGILSYASIIFSVLIHGLKCLKRSAQYDKSWYEICIIMGAVCLVSLFYNSLLKADFAYIAFFSLSISGIISKDSGKKSYPTNSI